MKSYRKQRGAAAIYTAMLLVPIFGTVFLALEGTRYVQQQNRLADASEAAALAVASVGGDQGDSNKLAKAYVQHYMPQQQGADADNVKVAITREDQFVQYKVVANTNHLSWLSSSLIPSFEEQVTVANKAIARNYHYGLENLDLVFVADFSSSMADEDDIWTEKDEHEIDVLKEAIRYIVEGLAKDDNGDVVNELPQIGIVPFNLRVRELNESNNKAWCPTYLTYNNFVDEASGLKYADVDWQDWSDQSYASLKTCADGGECPVGDQNEAKFIRMALKFDEFAERDNRAGNTHELSGLFPKHSDSEDVGFIDDRIFIDFGVTASIDISNLDYLTEHQSSFHLLDVAGGSDLTNIVGPISYEQDKALYPLDKRQYLNFCRQPDEDHEYGDDEHYHDLVVKDGYARCDDDKDDDDDDDDDHEYHYGANFYTLGLEQGLTTEQKLDKLDEMWPQGGSAAYQGLIRGAQMLHDSHDSERVKLILMVLDEDYDGDEDDCGEDKSRDDDESQNACAFYDLVEAGLCANLREQFGAGQLHIGLVGLDIEAKDDGKYESEYLTIYNCAGKPGHNNFLFAELDDELDDDVNPPSLEKDDKKQLNKLIKQIKTLLELDNEHGAASGVSTLHYRHLEH